MEDKPMSGESQDTLENVVTEEEVLKLFGITKGQLATCRNEKALPFLKINQRCRLYLERDLVEWLKTSRVVLNRG